MYIFMHILSYENISETCKEIIKNKPPDEAINIIANIKIKDNRIIGKKDAKQIYKIYSETSVKYSCNKYSDNVSEYKKKINNNIKKACGKKSVSDDNKYII